MAKCIYCGSFDPYTDGHESVILNALHIFDEIIILICDNPKKTKLFDTNRMKEAIQKRISAPIFENKVTVDILDPNMSAVNYAMNHNISHFIRGVRDNVDFSYEMTLANCNAAISDNKVKTIFIPTETDKAIISSSFIKALYATKDFATIQRFVSPEVYELIEKDFIK